ncbi:alpha/beta hydrolase [Gordonia sp. (in: high G+C Gram-positive bacteria)]|jgi:pimeloyl-ACP methyl ester carboxylesterase|uniref:alpha/beta fold hydrolase n=1 Tax=Gordonia sp. (in: high G+C Gram-positive bacteria) TaxID=84139 RepID=UPI001DA71DD0|nr:alpha/beta hydrolase [Gordonia sp. (in: high G+C Gram-positive bacteria)]MCB1293596.1 alpha/beta hydrolase [Gordonia sp. (in: high G+C Gram-positive bacteria)]HMS76406.1 alpha/beta hydrolase [Gordonia sp. (in: high G+C Gram-positive bacteria)]
MMEVERPKIEGSIKVGDDRRMGFAEWGEPGGRTFFWLHGTPGARRQIPLQARAYAAEKGFRLLGLDRPGVGASTAYRYKSVSEFPNDLITVADALDIDEFAVIGLSGGGPYTLATASAFPDRVVAAGILGGVAPTVGPERIGGGAMELGVRAAPLVRVAGAPIGQVLSSILSVAKPFGGPAVKLYGLTTTKADREALNRPEFSAMFLDDLIFGGRRQMTAPFSDILAFASDWGFQVSDIKVPVRWWHGDDDHIIPFSHGEHMVSLLPDAKLYPLPGDSHLSTLHQATDIIDELNAVWDIERPSKK